MTIDHIIKQSVEPIKDLMNGYYLLKLKNKNPYFNKKTKIWTKYRTVKIFICHCESCGQEDFRYNRPGEEFGTILCRKKKCKQTHFHKNIEPIEYNGKILRIEDCPKGYFRSFNNPLLAWIAATESNERRRQEHQTEEWKQSQIDQHKPWSYAYYVKTHPDLIIDSTKDWGTREKEWYDENPSNKRQWLDYRAKTRDKWISNNAERYRKLTNRNAKKHRMENPGIHIVKNLVRAIFRKAKKKKPTTTHKMGFDIQGIIDELRHSAKLLGFSGIRDIKSTRKYHVDHKIPCAAYDLSKHSERLKCTHPSNLHWLKARENLRKSDKIFEYLINTLSPDIYPESWNGIIPNNR